MTTLIFASCIRNIPFSSIQMLSNSFQIFVIKLDIQKQLQIITIDWLLYLLQLLVLFVLLNLLVLLYSMDKLYLYIAYHNKNTCCLQQVQHVNSHGSDVHKYVFSRSVLLGLMLINFKCLVCRMHSIFLSIQDVIHNLQ